MNTFYKVIIIHLIAMMIVFFVPFRSAASDVIDVDWPTSVSGKSHTIRISINGCDTYIKINDSDLKDLIKDSSMQKLIDIARSNCGK